MRATHYLIWSFTLLSLLFTASCKKDKPEPSQLSVDHTSFQVQPAGGELSLNITSNTNWQLTGAPAWVTLNKTEGSGNATVTLTVATNPVTTARTATLKLSANGAADITITITQALAAPALSIDKTTINFEMGAGEQNLAITSTITWTAVVSSGATWLTIDKTSGTSNATVKVSSTANTSATARTATVTFKGAGVNDVVITVAQKAQLVWEKTWGDGSSESFTDIVAVNDGFVCVGNIVTSANTNIYIAKLSLDGQTILKETTIDRTSDDRANAIIATADGGFVIVGYRKNGIAYDTYVVKVDANLVVVPGKEASFDKGSNEYGTTITAISDGGFIVSSKMVNSIRGEAYIFKLDANLVLVPGREITITKGTHNEVNAIIATSDGGFVVAGFFINNGTNYNSHIFKLDANLVVVPGKETILDKGNDDRAKDIIATSDGGFIVIGSIATGTGVFDTYIVKLDANLSPIQGKELLITKANSPYAITTTSNGGFIGVSDFNNGINTDIYIFELDANFNLLPEKEIIIDRGKDDTPHSIAAISDGGVVVAGKMHDNNNPNFYVARINK